MAGIYAIIGNCEHSRIQSAAKQLNFFPEEHIETASEPGFAFAWVGQDDPELFGPALDLKTGIQIVSAGRVAWDESEWQRATRLNRYQGGLSNRLLLQQYLQGGVRAIERHNGAAILLIWDPQQQQVHLLTDHFGYYPIFFYQPERVDGCVIASLPDAIADNSAVQLTPDRVSFAEFLQQGKATPPHTFYQEVKYVGAATHCCWDLARSSYRRREYWQPFPAEHFSSLSSAVEKLAVAVRQSIHTRTLPRLGPIASYTSGGLDSRLILFAAADPGCLYGVNLYDLPNQEAAIAQKLCQTAGVKYVGCARDSDYYPQSMRLGAIYSGAMWSLADNHFLGTRDLVCGQLQARTVLSACSADFLFKFANLDRSYISVPLINEVSPFYRFEPGNRSFIDPPPSRHAQPTAFTKASNQRLQEWFAVPSGLSTEEARLWIEDKRNRPLCYASGLPLQLMFRSFPYDTFLADRAIADCYSRIPAQWKINSRLWGLVVAQICGRSIIDANYGWKPGATTYEKLQVFTKYVLRKKLKSSSVKTSPSLATNGSWPNWGWYVNHSSTLRTMWETTSLADRRLISDLWGSDPWQLPLDQWAGSRHDFFRITTLLTYLAVRQETKPRVAELSYH